MIRKSYSHTHKLPKKHTKGVFVWLGLIASILLASAVMFYLMVTSSSTHIYTYKRIEDIKEPVKIAEPIKITHIATPEAVRGVYMSSWVAGTPEVRSKIISLIDQTELNAVVIDVKDSSGTISFEIPGEEFAGTTGESIRIRDIHELLSVLHSKNIYVIGRVAVFQDPIQAKKHTDRAILSKKTGEIWKDRAGLSWIDASSREQWEYVDKVATYAYGIGFDEINFDYIRFPSDGDLEDMKLRVNIQNSDSKEKVVSTFFEYIGKQMKDKNIPSSADIFGLTTIRSDDLGIGQKLESALMHFDYVSPMTYPSHYGEVFTTFSNPNAHPYETIKESYIAALKKIDALAKKEASSTSSTGEVAIDTNLESKLRTKYIHKLRPWYQDFSLGVTYDKDMVRAQIRAGEELGIANWLLWDPKNKYTKDALNTQ